MEYDNENHNLERHDSLWQRLFALSNNDSLNIKNVWSSFANEGGKTIVKKNKFLRDKVNFEEPILKNVLKATITKY